MENLKMHEQTNTGIDSRSAANEFKTKEITEIGSRNAEDFLPDIRFIENTSPQALFAQNCFLNELGDFNALSSETKEDKREGLTEDEKSKVKEVHSDWSDEVIDKIGLWDEYEIYDNANLQYADIDGKPCLIRTDIDMEQKDAFGRTNKERMEDGLAPLDQNGNRVELHHVGQKADSPLAELTLEEHHCNGNDTILHDKTKETEVHGEGNNWDNERRNHWENRAKVEEVK